MVIKEEGYHSLIGKMSSKYSKRIKPKTIKVNRTNNLDETFTQIKNILTERDNVFYDQIGEQQSEIELLKKEKLRLIQENDKLKNLLSYVLDKSKEVMQTTERDVAV